MYHIEDNGQPLVSLGFIIGLDYKNPHRNLYQVTFTLAYNEINAVWKATHYLISIMTRKFR